MIDGVAVGHCGAKVLLFVKAAPVLATLQNLIFRAVKHWPWTLRRCPPQLCRKIAAQLWSTCVMQRPFCVKVGWEDVQCTEPPWTYLNILKPILCAGEQLGNHFKFVGTDLWTIEPIGTCRNQVGTNLEPNGTSLCMEELGDGFSFVFVVCGVFGCCLTHVLGTWCCDCIRRSFVGYLWVWAEDVLFGEAERTFFKLENSFEVVWEVWERLSVTAFYSARLF